jgi:hypothetical protein
MKSQSVRAMPRRVLVCATTDDILDEPLKECREMLPVTDSFVLKPGPDRLKIHGGGLFVNGMGV